LSGVDELRISHLRMPIHSQFLPAGEVVAEEFQRLGAARVPVKIVVPDSVWPAGIAAFLERALGVPDEQLATGQEDNVSLEGVRTLFPVRPQGAISG